MYVVYFVLLFVETTLVVMCAIVCEILLSTAPRWVRHKELCRLFLQVDMKLQKCLVHVLPVFGPVLPRWPGHIKLVYCNFLVDIQKTEMDRQTPAAMS